MSTVEWDCFYAAAFKYSLPFSILLPESPKMTLQKVIVSLLYWTASSAVCRTVEEGINFNYFIIHLMCASYKCHLYDEISGGDGGFFLVFF